MKPFRIEIPAGQNWSCHGCGACCRGMFLVRITAAEKARIEQQNWTPADGVDPARMVIAEHGYLRLAHNDDGACVFLDANGRCRIHAKFGEPAKPFACRLYPFVLHPVGDKLVAGIRFSCPSAAASLGQPMPERAAEFRDFAREVVPENFSEEPPPPIVAAPDGEWKDFQRFVKWLEATLAEKNVPIALKLLRALHWLHAIEKGSLEQISGEGAEEILGALNESAREKLPALPKDFPPPSTFGRMFLRMMVVEHARKISIEEMNAPAKYRWKMLRAIVKFLPAGGHTPELQANLKRVKFADVENFTGSLPPDAEETLTRFFRMKIQSVHFCGRAFHDAALLEGFHSLALLYPVVIWLSRWQAVSAGRNKISNDDVQRAISMADYHHGFSAWLRWRVRLLAQRDDITRLCAWYGR